VGREIGDCAVGLHWVWRALGRLGPRNPRGIGTLAAFMGCGAHGRRHFQAMPPRPEPPGAALEPSRHGIEARHDPDGPRVPLIVPWGVSCAARTKVETQIPVAQNKVPRMHEPLHPPAHVALPFSAIIQGSCEAPMWVVQGEHRRMMENVCS
jgi:hypothetical protein